jgi:hypothetical protein
MKSEADTLRREPSEADNAAERQPISGEAATAPAAEKEFDPGSAAACQYFARR